MGKNLIESSSNGSNSPKKRPSAFSPMIKRKSTLETNRIKPAGPRRGKSMKIGKMGFGKSMNIKFSGGLNES